MTNSKTILEIKGLKKTFKSDLFKAKTEALKGIDCRFPEGCTTAVIGHNGAGKTTLIRTVLGLFKPDEGEVLFRGEPIQPEDRCNFGYMPEVHRLTGALTPYETLAIHLKFYPQISSKKHSELIEKSLKRVGLLEHSKKHLRHLSKGLQRRVAFALATIHSPKLIILDEPFSGLDPLGHSHMEKWIEEEKHRGASIIMSSHQVSSIVKTCDYFNVIMDGKVAYSSLNDSSSASSHSSYGIEISGIDEDALKDIMLRHSLEEPSAWHNTQYQHSIAYENYTDATKAIKTFLSEGVMLSSFGETSNITESIILSMLQNKGEHK